jgi:hypothetical protein
MNQTMATTMFYGNPATDPKQFLGLASRYSSTSAGNGSNVIKAGGTGSDNTSIFLVVWGDQTVYCPFPKGSAAGLLHEDLGEQTVYNSDNTRLQAYATRYQWKSGLVVKDWRYVVRICNIDASDISATTGASSQAATSSNAVIRLMNKALNLIPNLNMGRPVFYMNRTVYNGLALQAMEKSVNVLAVQQGLSQFGTPTNWLSYLGVPVRKCDALTVAEGLVS